MTPPQAPSTLGFHGETPHWTTHGTSEGPRAAGARRAGARADPGSAKRSQLGAAAGDRDGLQESTEGATPAGAPSAQVAYAARSNAGGDRVSERPRQPRHAGVPKIGEARRCPWRGEASAGALSAQVADASRSNTGGDRVPERPRWPRHAGVPEIGEARSFIGERVSGPLFPHLVGRAMTTRYVNRRLQHWLKTAGFERPELCHSLRRAFATSMGLDAPVAS